MRPAPVVLMVLAYGAGLATGLARFQVPVAAGLSLVAIVLWRRGDLVLVPLAVLGGLGQAGVAHTVTRHRCAARLQPGPVAMRIRLEEPGRAGPLLARPIGAGCTGVVTLRWPAGAERPAGAVLSVTGRWQPRRDRGGAPGGMLTVGTVGHTLERGSGAPRLRGWLRGASEALYGARAPMVDALVLGRRAEMDPELREAFTRSGLVHLLSISGFHVGLIVAWVVLLLRVAGVARGTSAVVAAGGAVAYVAFLGWPAPATRAAVLAVLAALSLLRQRRVRPTPLLALTCLLVVLGDPWAVFDLGGWLSAAALWGASTFSRWGEQAIGPGLAGRTLFASIGATLATAPISAAMFGTVALAGIGLNFAAIPLAAVAVPGILASLLALPVLPEVARSFAAGSGLALAGLERLALAGAAIPGGAITTPTGWPGALTWGGVLVLACWITADRTPWRESAWRMAWVAAAILWIPPAATEWRSRHDGEGRLALFFLAVGQGDAIAIRTPGGHWVLVDVGPAGEGRDAGRQVVAPFLRRHGVRRVALLLVSHGHADHLGGAGAILQRYQVDAAMEPGWPLRDSLYQGFLADLAAEEARWSPARAGDRWQLDGVRFSVLHPDTTWSGWGEDLNEDSVVLLVEFGGFRALLTGDAGLPVERRLRGRVGAVDLLKAGHHGSRTATGAGWLAELDPRAVVLSVGRNRYGHPAPAVLNQVASQGASLWRTDQDGTVQVNTDGCRVAVTAGRRTLDYRIEREPCHAGQP